jgi:hypothetical protein
MPPGKVGFKLDLENRVNSTKHLFNVRFFHEFTLIINLWPNHPTESIGKPKSEFFGDL